MSSRYDVKTLFQKVTPNKYDNLLRNDSGNIFAEALVIKEVKYDWNEKRKALQKKLYNEKVILKTKRKMTLI